MNFELVLISLVILIFSAILHEIAHGVVAERLGDPTARLMGRITLNPIPHIDPVLSLFLPLAMIISQIPLILAGQPPFIIGGAKPVPVDPFNLRDGRRDLAIVSLAGPLTNFIIAIVFALSYKFGAPFINDPLILFVIFTIIKLNLLLGIFNLLPIPPLDGSKVFSLLLPEDTARSYLSLSSIGFLIIFFLLMPISPIPLGSILSNLLNAALHLLGI